MYQHGEGVEKDITKDVSYLKRRTVPDDVLASICLGVMYEHGVSVEKNSTKARELYEEARRAGFPQAGNLWLRLQLLFAERSDLI